MNKRLTRDLGNPNNNVKNYKTDVIYSSTDFNKFKFKPGNRDLNQKHILEVADSMREKGWFGAPIEISLTDNNDFLVEEGQHRVEAAKLSLTPIKFIVVPPRSIYDTATQNSLTKKWNAYDYINAHAKDGNMSYKRLKNVIDRFPEFNWSEVLHIANITTNDNFKKGYVRFPEERQQKVIYALEQMKDIKRVLKDINMAQTSYTKVLAVLIINDVIDTKRMTSQIDKYGSQFLVPVRRTNFAVDYIERVYNHCQRNKVFLVSEYKRLTQNNQYV